MAGTLKGAPELHRRLKAIGSLALPSGAGPAVTRRWQQETTKAAQRMIPVRTGGTRRSLRPGRTRRGNATVVGFYTVNFIDAGSKAHVEPRQRGLTKTGRVSRRKVGTGKVLKFSDGGQPRFRKKVNKRAIAARPFKLRAAQEGLRNVPFGEYLIDVWNKAA